MLLEKIWRDFLRKYDLNSTWYYRDHELAWAEYAVLRAVARDGYNDAEEAYQLLQSENHSLEQELIAKQLKFMSLEEKEQRLIFHEISSELTAALAQAKESERDYTADIYAVFHAVAQSEEDGKIKAFADNFIYLPKCALLQYFADKTSGEDEKLYRKFILSKPKLAKACFNELFSAAYTEQI